MPGEKTDFARSKWGDSISDVIAKHSGEPLFLYTSEQLFGMDAEAVHCFASNGKNDFTLVQGNYKFFGEDVEKDGETTFKKAMTELMSKYGDPDSAMFFNENKTQYDTLEEMLSSSDAEHLKCTAQALWRDEKTSKTSMILDGSFSAADSIGLIIMAPQQ